MKTTMKTLVLLLLTVTFGYNLQAASNPPIDNDKKVNAEELVQKTERAVAFIVKAGQETTDENLKRKNKHSEPFWNSVKKLNSAVEKLNNSLFLKDDGFHKALGETVTAKEQLLTTYEMLGAKDPKVKEGINKASLAVSLLYDNYSKEALRKKDGAELTSKEKKQLDEIKLKNKELQGKLTELEAKVGNNKEMLKKVKKIKEKSNQVVHCGHHPSGFFFAMSAMHMINGWMWAYHWYWGPWGGWYPGFYYGYVDIYVDVFDDYAYDWGYLDGAIDAYDYDLDVDLMPVEMDGADAYLNDTYDQYDTYQDQAYDNEMIQEEMIQEEMMPYQEVMPEQYDEMQPQMQPQIEYEMMDSYPAANDMDYMDMPMDFDY